MITAKCISWLISSIQWRKNQADPSPFLCSICSFYISAHFSNGTQKVHHQYTGLQKWITENKCKTKFLQRILNIVISEWHDVPGRTDMHNADMSSMGNFRDACINKKKEKGKISHCQTHIFVRRVLQCIDINIHNIHA